MSRRAATIDDMTVERARVSRSRRGRLAAAATLIVVSAMTLQITSRAAAIGLVAPNAEPAASPSGPAPAFERWTWPAPPPIHVTSPFRAPATRYASGHRGIDLAVLPGAVLVAPGHGLVSFAGQVAGRGVVAIDHGDGVISAIEPVEALVVTGAEVAEGDPIGVASVGGHCDARCVHFGVRVDGEYVSPFLFLGGLPRAVLLPAG